MISLSKALLSAAVPVVSVLALFRVGTGTPPGGTWWVATVAVALAAALWQSTIFRLTGNRVVSVLSGLLAVLHPWVAKRCADEAFFREAAASVLVLAVLRLGLRAEARTSRIPHLVLSWTLLGLAAFFAPILLAAPLLFTLLRRTFFRDVRASGAHAGGPVELPFGTGIIFALVAVALQWSKQSGELATAPGGSAVADDVVALMTGVTHGPGHELSGSGAFILAFLVGAALILAVMARVRSRVQPSWLLRHAAFGLLWLALWALLSLAIGRLSLISLFGAAFILPAMAWRLLLGSPLGRGEETRLAVGPPPTVVVRPDPALQPRSGSVSTASPAALPSAIPAVSEVRARVDAAVSSAVEASVASLLAGLQKLDETRASQAPTRARSQRLRTLPDGAALALAAVAEEETRSAREDGVFASILAPHLALEVRILELEPSRYSSGVIRAGGRYVCVGSTPIALEKARRLHGDSARTLFVLGGEDLLGAIPDENHDLIFGAEALIARNAVRTLKLLVGAARVLRPGGVAILGFANLTDALGRGALVAAAMGRAPEREWMTVEMLRVLAAESGLEVEGVHLTADGCTSFAIFRRSLPGKRGAHG